jgi:hypothetical protein
VSFLLSDKNAKETKIMKNVQEANGSRFRLMDKAY